MEKLNLELEDIFATEPSAFTPRRLNERDWGVDLPEQALTPAQSLEKLLTGRLAGSVAFEKSAKLRKQLRSRALAAGILASDSPLAIFLGDDEAKARKAVRRLMMDSDETESKENQEDGMEMMDYVKAMSGRMAANHDRMAAHNEAKAEHHDNMSSSHMKIAAVHKSRFATTMDGSDKKLAAAHEEHADFHKNLAAHHRDEAEFNRDEAEFHRSMAAKAVKSVSTNFEKLVPSDVRAFPPADNPAGRVTAIPRHGSAPMPNNIPQEFEKMFSVDAEN